MQRTLAITSAQCFVGLVESPGIERHRKPFPRIGSSSPREELLVIGQLDGLVALIDDEPRPLGVMLRDDAAFCSGRQLEAYNYRGNVGELADAAGVSTRSSTGWAKTARGGQGDSRNRREAPRGATKMAMRATCDWCGGEIEADDAYQRGCATLSAFGLHADHGLVVEHAGHFHAEHV
jgi:hypothetical protein